MLTITKKNYEAMYGNIANNENIFVMAKCNCTACNSCACGRCSGCISQCTGCKKKSDVASDVKW
ncbi:MAG: hypothetical protein K0Q87_1661 [Neobacillus sp.]|jgi:hypothetical protein|nr:hypothetical protein [Neobacillus sp.]